MALTDDFTYQFGDDGIILNSDAINTAPFVDILSVKGLDSAPFRTANKTREGMDGSFLDAEFEDGRTVVLEGMIYSPPLQMETFLDALKENYAPSRTSKPFNLIHPGVAVRTLFSKSLGVNYDVDSLRRTGTGKVQFQIRAEDPSIYGPEFTVFTTIAAAVTGRGYNRSYNYGYGGSSGNGSVAIQNDGNKPTGGILRIFNTLNPTVIFGDGSVRLIFNIDIDGNNYLEIDLRNRRISINGTANRRTALLGGSQWFLFPKGISSVALLGTPSGGTPLLTVTTRSAYR